MPIDVRRPGDAIDEPEMVLVPLDDLREALSDLAEHEGAAGEDQTDEEARTLDGISVTDPDWSSATKVHDWRNHVPEEVREAWPGLPLIAQRVAAMVAAEAASKEEWD